MKVGQKQIDAKGNKLEVVVEIPKKDCRTDLVINKSIYKTFGVLFNDNAVQMALHKKTNEFIKFTNKCKDKLNTKDFSIKYGDFDEIVFSGHESDNGMVYKNVHFSDGVCEFIYKGVEICLVPWHDGVMLQTILVPKELRGNKLATFIMADLDEISTDLDIPLYLVPYPGENYNPNDEFELELQLKHWYERLDFGKANESTNTLWPKVWCNFE
jgi:hypothetical protein